MTVASRIPADKEFSLHQKYFWPSNTLLGLHFRVNVVLQFGFSHFGFGVIPKKWH